MYAIYGNIDHQYTPVLFASIYHTYGSYGFFIGQPYLLTRTILQLGQQPLGGRHHTHRRGGLRQGAAGTPRAEGRRFSSKPTG